VPAAASIAAALARLLRQAPNELPAAADDVQARTASLRLVAFAHCRHCHCPGGVLSMCAGSRRETRWLLSSAACACRAGGGGGAVRLAAAAWCAHGRQQCRACGDRGDGGRHVGHAACALPPPVAAGGWSPVLCMPETVHRSSCVCTRCCKSAYSNVCMSEVAAVPFGVAVLSLVKPTIWIRAGEGRAVQQVVTRPTAEGRHDE